ncbi:hypothetical protein [Mycoplasmopsis felifaucium]|uniref:hypothetical protein n=1 Tax=Mycoplasmopsis felifaucium TaxID=35768 RepID=UPI0004859920|nr:hypothetical protein [Mycoplasmopsis felifaucium]
MKIKKLTLIPVITGTTLVSFISVSCGNSASNETNVNNTKDSSNNQMILSTSQLDTVKKSDNYSKSDSDLIKLSEVLLKKLKNEVNNSAVNSTIYKNLEENLTNFKNQDDKAKNNIIFILDLYTLNNNGINQLNSEIKNLKTSLNEIDSNYYFLIFDYLNSKFNNLVLNNEILITDVDFINKNKHNIAELTTNINQAKLKINELKLNLYISSYIQNPTKVNNNSSNTDDAINSDETSTKIKLGEVLNKVDFAEDGIKDIYKKINRKLLSNGVNVAYDAQKVSQNVDDPIFLEAFNNYLKSSQDVFKKQEAITINSLQSGDNINFIDSLVKLNQTYLTSLQQYMLSLRDFFDTILGAKHLYISSVQSFPVLSSFKIFFDLINKSTSYMDLFKNNELPTLETINSNKINLKEKIKSINDKYFETGVVSIGSSNNESSVQILNSSNLYSFTELLNTVNSFENRIKNDPVKSVSMQTSVLVPLSTLKASIKSFIDNLNEALTKNDLINKLTYFKGELDKIRSVEDGTVIVSQNKRLSNLKRAYFEKELISQDENGTIYLPTYLEVVKSEKWKNEFGEEAINKIEQLLEELKVQLNNTYPSGEEGRTKMINDTIAISNKLRDETYKVLNKLWTANIQTVLNNYKTAAFEKFENKVKSEVKSKQEAPSNSRTAVTELAVSTNFNNSDPKTASIGFFWKDRLSLVDFSNNILGDFLIDFSRWIKMATKQKFVINNFTQNSPFLPTPETSMEAWLEKRDLIGHIVNRVPWEYEESTRTIKLHVYFADTAYTLDSQSDNFAYELINENPLDISITYKNNTNN